MMELEIDLNKSVEENAGRYFDLAKKAKKKLEGAKEALMHSRKELQTLERQEASFQEQETVRKEKKERKQEWYEKFHWFFSSEDFLCIGGKDATSNEIIIKKHLDKEDLVFHTEMSGSPFFIVKNGQEAGEATKREAAQAVAVYSKAWKLGHSTADVFYVLPEQVSKETQPGEFIGKGSFVVRGKTTQLRCPLEYALAFVDGQVIAGPETAVKKKASKYVLLVPGGKKKSDAAKLVRKKLQGGDLDDYVKFIPSGGAEVKFL